MAKEAVVTKHELYEALDKFTGDIVGQMRTFMDMTQEQFDQVDERFDRLEAGQNELMQRLSQLETDMQYLKREMSEMKLDVQLTKGEQQALRNDIKEFYLELQRVSKKVERLDELEPKEQRITRNEVQRLAKWAASLGERAGFPYPLPSAKA